MTVATMPPRHREEQPAAPTRPAEASAKEEALAKAGSDEAIPNSSPSLKIASLRSQ
jgi:hypothetical protein